MWPIFKCHYKWQCLPFQEIMTVIICNNKHLGSKCKNCLKPAILNSLLTHKMKRKLFSAVLNASLVLQLIFHSRERNYVYQNLSRCYFILTDF